MIKFDITVLETTNDNLTLDFVKAKLLDVKLKHKNSKDDSKPTSSSKDDCTFSVGNSKYQSHKIKCFKCENINHLNVECSKNT